MIHLGATSKNNRLQIWASETKCLFKSIQNRHIFALFDKFSLGEGAIQKDPWQLWTWRASEPRVRLACRFEKTRKTQKILKYAWKTSKFCCKFQSNYLQVSISKLTPSAKKKPKAMGKTCNGASTGKIRKRNSFEKVKNIEICLKNIMV